MFITSIVPSGTIKEALTVGSYAPFPAGSVVHGVVEGCAAAAKGSRAVLVLRAEIEGQWGGVAPPIERYVDTGYYERALKLVGAR